MEENKLVQSLRFAPKITTALGFPVLIMASLLLFLGRKYPALEFTLLPELLPGFYSHVSNFTISLLLYLSPGYFGLMMGISIKQLGYYGILLIFANLLMELFIPVLNTPDITDALYGTVGVFFGFVLMVAAKKFGMKALSTPLLIGLLTHFQFQGAPF